MSSVLVDGLVLPVAVGGHPALDFCNTRAGWGSPAPKEYLRSYDHLAVWAGWAGLIDAGAVAVARAAAHRDPAAAQDVLRTALELREASYPVALGPGTPASFGIVAAQARTARAAATLRPAVGESGPAASWVFEGEAVAAPLLAVAGQLADLLCSPLSRVVAACPGRGCGWLFADPRRRRRWCDMAVCGNRAKARRHAAARGAAVPSVTLGSREARRPTGLPENGLSRA